jgi:hypothetical protein
MRFRHVDGSVSADPASSAGIPTSAFAEAGIPNYWRVETGRDGATVHVYALAEGGTYTRTHLVRPGQTVAVDAPWPVDLAPPEYAAP